ncbi:MAG TPA: ATP-binding cassette domain-containing protein, partial [Zoogloea sp.]|nr:ATP-binding cassette domain-containing protein [Zoogloea sp.]
MGANIEIRDAFKTFGNGPRAIQALEAASLDIRPNEFVTFVGASGCGKSTLLRMIGGLESLTSGSIAVNGQGITGPGVDRAMVFQHYSLYPWLT